jgi:hypothetical protein
MPGDHRLAGTVQHMRRNPYYQIRNRKNRRPDPGFAVLVLGRDGLPLGFASGFFPKLYLSKGSCLTKSNLKGRLRSFSRQE